MPHVTPFLTSAEVRARYLGFFEHRGHSAQPSGPLVIPNDPTLFFANAGMVQFKDVFLGRDPRPYSRATTSQKCLRVSGKHNDLENVGHTARHHTFFEMLGNFSFGDYFKREAIQYAWEFLTGPGTRGCMQIDPDRLWVTVYEEDDEALAIWRDEVGVPAARIQKLGKKDNFWQMGDTGPCGPCTEIHYDHGPAISDDLRGPAGEDPRYVEIWNLVFMQYDRAADGTLNPLPRPSIDTGSGLERVCAVVQGVYSNYDTDVFLPILHRGAALAGHTYGTNPELDVALKVIADHSRAAAFLIAEGVMPSNIGIGYVLRRVMRRAIRYGVKIGLKPGFYTETVGAVIEHFGVPYPELVERAGFIRDVTHAEEQRFASTLGRGLVVLEKELELSPERVRGPAAFQLADTYGFPLDLTQMIAAERGAEVDEDGFKVLLAEQKAKGRAAWKGAGGAFVEGVWLPLAQRSPTTFTGYDAEGGEGIVVAIVSEGALVTTAHAGEEVAIVLDRTPFYAESGGQVGDTGRMTGPRFEGTVTETSKPTGDLHVHHVTIVSGSLRLGDPILAEVDHDARSQTRANHSATHLLHAALREVLGAHVTQKGSLVGPDRLRFDFAHHKAMSLAEQRAVEDRVNQQIRANNAVETEVLAIDDARQSGAMGLFGEKYGDRVRVLTMGDYSKELCGGTHARRTGDIGMFKLLSEAGIAAGIRRVEAQTGTGAIGWVHGQEDGVRAIAALLKAPASAEGGLSRLIESVEQLQESRARLQKELDAARRELAQAKAGDLTKSVVMVDGVQVLAVQLDVDPKSLREEAERLRDQLGSVVVVLATPDEGGVKLVVAVSKDLAGTRCNAGKLVGTLAAMVGGRGGGRPDLAQAGGTDATKIAEMLASVPGIVAGG
ncbi:MAG: alanine--tRNA ligase [Myxococcales bacterium]|nr:alanine--tRNA ligase [Myxococcales bacterium]